MASCCLLRILSGYMKSDEKTPDVGVGPRTTVTGGEMGVDEGPCGMPRSGVPNPVKFGSKTPSSTCTTPDSMRMFFETTLM